MEECILGLDLGTSGVKAGILDLSSGTLEHVTHRQYENSPQQDTNKLFVKTLEALGESVERLEDGKQVIAVGLTGQMHGAVLFDESGEIIPPLINWQDQEYSSGAIVAEIREITGFNDLDVTGIEMSSGLTGAILFGIKQAHPGLFSRIHKFVLPTDFIRGKLLGRLHHATDPTNAFGTGLFNTKQSSWHQDLIRKLGLPQNIFPEIHPTSEIAGTLHPDIASRIGLENNVPLIIGGGDNQMSMLGSGLIDNGSPMLINIGTAAQISVVTPDFLRVSSVDTRSYFNGLYAFVGASLSGGGSYGWLKDKISAEVGVEIPFAELDRLAAQVPPGADGLVFCPGPSRNTPDRRMGFYGNLPCKRSIGHRARAVMEGVILDLYELYLAIQSYSKSEFVVGAGKGLQNSRIWPQIAADIFRKQIKITNFENALFGAAMMAAYGTGAVDNFDQMIRAIKYDRHISPNAVHTARYRNDVIDGWKSVVDLV